MKKVIYIVDDSRFMLKILEEKILLIDPKIKLILINNPEDLNIDEIPSEAVAMIVDYNMPKMNGIELILKVSKVNKKLAFLLLSAGQKISTDEGLPDKLIFVQKPITDQALENYIKGLI